MKTFVVSVFFCGVLVVSAACKSASASKQELWILPDGYVGWLRLDYSVEGSAPLVADNGRYVIAFPVSGRVLTSSMNKPRAERNEYRSSGPAGAKRLKFSAGFQINEYAVQSSFSFGKGTLGGGWRWAEAECVFVGTRADFQSNGRNCAAWQRDQAAPPKFR